MASSRYGSTYGNVQVLMKGKGKCKMTSKRRE